MSKDYPRGWSNVLLTEVAAVAPRRLDAAIDDDRSVSFVPMAAVEELTGRADVSARRRWGDVKRGYTSMLDGDLVFAKITPCMENGKVALVEGLHGGIGVGSTELVVIRPYSATDPRYLLHYLLREQLRRDARAVMQGAAGQLRVPVSFLQRLSVPLPPLAEQRRIVAALEEQLSELDAAVAGLERARARIARYRAAVLRDACNGTLQAEGADDACLHGDTEVDTQVRPGPSVSPHDLASGQLPDHWQIVSLDSLTIRVTSGSRDWSRFYNRGSGTFIMAQNVRPGRLDLSFRQSVDPPPNDRDRARSQVHLNDVLITIVGANTGDVCLVPNELPEHYVCQSVALVRPFCPEVGPWIAMFLSSPENGQRQFQKFMYGQGRPHLSFDQLRTVAIPLPPLTVQRAILTEVERRMTVVDSISNELNIQLARATRLRQAILQHAFEGKLVEQDPNDEPASALLDRIRTAREHATRSPSVKARTKSRSPSRIPKK